MIIAKYDDVILREFEERDIELKVKWINDFNNNQFLHYDLPASVERTREWFNGKDNSKRVDCTIEYNGIPVGVIGLLRIDNINRKAEYYITVGDTSFKKKGIGAKATKAIVEYGFNVLKLNKIFLNVDSENKSAIKLYEKVGFKQEGHFVEDLYSKRKNRFIDRDRYSVIKHVKKGE
ncbi:GNAT family N-acetyltransferase [Anaerorhabdus sp.]|uniref:GNAT family N-acetyltransferase n=1 Tax=Anaerorhabdus sp. TaxID=1872524 RepID=UPI002FC8BD1F